MKTTIITDRLTIEKMAADIFLDKQLLRQDIRDLQKLREKGTFRYAISCKDTATNCIDGIQEAITEKFPEQEATYIMCNFAIADSGDKITYDEMAAIIKKVQEVLPADKIWRSLNSSNDVLPEEIRINLLFLFEKTEEDREEDIRMDKMFNEYLTDNPPIPELPWFVETL
ncbi:MAG: hypothetical protein NC308_10000 [Clostridium sp.]|nr:hypothetical protein [Bacteroides sp.]MCM1199207.1 hypothetical protein [Clostridium sp.]